MISSIFVLLFFLIYELSSFVTHASSDISNVIASQENRYAIIVDAGSSGSRLFVYRIPTHENGDNSLPPITLCLDAEGKPLTKKVNPGLSSFASDPSSAQAYISGLLSIAAHNIPRQYHSVTPVYILATAGMRLLTERFVFTFYLFTHI